MHSIRFFRATRKCFFVFKMNLRLNYDVRLLHITQFQNLHITYFKNFFLATNNINKFI